MAIGAEKGQHCRPGAGWQLVLYGQLFGKGVGEGFYFSRRSYCCRCRGQAAVGDEKGVDSGFDHVGAAGLVAGPEDDLHAVGDRYQVTQFKSRGGQPLAGRRFDRFQQDGILAVGDMYGQGVVGRARTGLFPVEKPSVVA